MHPPPSITTFRNHGGYWQPQRIQQDDQTIEITQPYTAISFVRSFLSLHSSFLLALITDLVSSVYTVLQYSIGFLSLIPSEMLACLSPPQEFSFVFSPENQARDAFLSSEITRQSSSCYSFAFLSQCRVFKTFLCLRPIFTISRLACIHICTKYPQITSGFRENTGASFSLEPIQFGSTRLGFSRFPLQLCVMFDD